MRSTVTKTFVFEREDTQQSITCSYDLDCESEEVNVEKIFKFHCSSDRNRILIYDPISHEFIPLHNSECWNGTLPQRLLEPSIILVRYAIKELLEIDHDLSISGESEECSERERGGQIRHKTIS